MKGKRARINRMLRRQNKEHKSPDYFASCHGKIRYDSFEQAQNASLEKPSIVKAYKCRHCAYYHIGRRFSK